VRTSPARAWATIRFVNCLSSSKEVLDEHGMWPGSAPSADHLRRAGIRVRRGVAGPGVAARSPTVPSLAVLRRRSSRRWATGGDGGGGLHRLAVCGRGAHRGGLRGAPGRAGGYAGGEGPQAARQDGPLRRPAAARVVAVRRSPRVVDPADRGVGVARTGPALQVAGRSTPRVDATHPRRVVPARRRRSRSSDRFDGDAGVVGRRRRHVARQAASRSGWGTR
jgi:hypothetical protein